MRTNKLDKWSFDIFQHAPVSLWIEDFSGVRKQIDHLASKGVLEFRKYLDRHPEEVLALAKKVKIIAVNDATLQFFRAEGTEEFYQGLTKVFDKETYDVFREELIALSEGRTEFAAETVHRVLGGEKKYVQIRLKVAPGCEKDWSRVYVAVNDISGQKQREADLRASEAKYRKMFENDADAILVVDSETGIIVNANKRAEQMTGNPVENMLGMHHTQLYPRGEEADYEMIFQRCMQTGICLSENLFVNHRSGERVPVSTRLYSMEINRKKMIVVNLREAPQRKRVKSDTAISMQDRHAHSAPQKITARECEVVRLIARGFTNGQIAERLHISKKTVETHRTRVMNKLNLHKATDLVRYAMTAGLIDSGPRRQQ